MSAKPYPKYKSVRFPGVESIPVSWEPTRLRFAMSLNPSKQELKKENKEVTFLPMERVSEKGELDLSETKMLHDVGSGYSYFRDADVLLAKITPCFENGKGALCAGLKNGVGFGTTEFQVMRPERVEPHFLFYLTRTDSFRKFGEACMKGTAGQKRVPDRYLKDYQLGLPSNTEQGRIVEFLDREIGKIDELVAEKKNMLGLLEEKRQAIITDAVTGRLQEEIGLPNPGTTPSGIDWLGDIPKHWSVLPIKRLSSKTGSGKTPRGGAEVYKDEGIYFLRSMNVRFEGLRLDNAVFISKEVHKSMSSSCVLPEDVLLNITGASIGRVSLVPKGFPEANVNQHVCIVRPRKDVIEPGYLALVMASSIVQSQIKSYESGSSREGLNFQQAGSMLASVPGTVDEQRKIVEYVDGKMSKLNDLVSEIKSAIGLLKEHRTALVTAAVTGQIDVREV
jgi:type I restriction enzyme S subunit